MSAGCPRRIGGAAVAHDRQRSLRVVDRRMAVTCTAVLHHCWCRPRLPLGRGRQGLITTAWRWDPGAFPLSRVLAAGSCRACGVPSRRKVDAMTDAARKTGRMGSPANAVETWAWPTPWIESPDRAEGVGSRHGEGTPLAALYVEKGASPWLGQLTRKGVVSGRLSRMVEAGIRGVAADRDILASALET